MWIIAILASLAVLITLVLSVPLDIALRMDVYGRPSFGLKLAWLFGLVSKEVGKGKKRPEEKKEVVEGKRKLKERGERARTTFQILRIKGLLRQLKGLLRDIISRVKVREFGVDFRVGLDDPADMGLLFAFIRPATILMNPPFPYQIRVQPSFDGEAILEGYLYGAARLRPIQLVTPFLRFAFSLATIRAAKILVLHKWKGKK